MRLPTPFDPLAPGELDNFYFDFTADVGAASIQSTSWTCAMEPPLIAAADPHPQRRIRSTFIASLIQRRSPIDGSLQPITGYFSGASVGTMPATAAGSTYVLESTVSLSDGRTLKVSATVLCQAAT